MKTILISQNKKRKITFVDTMLVLLVIFITVPIPYQKQLYAQSEVGNTNPSEREKNVITVDDEREIFSEEARYRVLEEIEKRTEEKEAPKVVVDTEEKGKEPTLEDVYRLLKEIQRKLEEKEKGTQEVEGYLTGIKITNWSLYVAWGVATIHHVTIENTSDIAYKDIKVRANYYYSYSYSSTNATPARVGKAEGTLPVTVPPHSKETYFEKGIALKLGSACSMYEGARDIEVLGAIPEAIPVTVGTIRVQEKMK